MLQAGLPKPKVRASLLTRQFETAKVAERPPDISAEVRASKTFGTPSDRSEPDR